MCILNVNESVFAIYFHSASCIAHHFHCSPFSVLTILNGHEVYQKT